jgi:manganese/zinc/iron transport system ATP- binding protein
MPPPAIELHNLTVVYEQKPAIWNLDFQMPGGQMIGVVGPNGSGKSTMLKAVMGLIEPGSGYVRIFGEALDAVRQRMAYVPQRSSVDWDFPITVFETVLMGRIRPGSLLRRPSRQDREVALECLRRVQMEPFRERQISQLSGGQQQRVFIARALAQEGELYLLDEPFAGVDASTEAAIVALLKEMKAQGKTIMVVHHDLQSVPEYFDSVVMLNTRLVAAGPVGSAFTLENLQQTYGGSLSILAQVSHLVGAGGHLLREDH